MPGANTRAMNKARSLACDTIIFDLEDAVAPDAKDQAREQVATALGQGGYGYRELIVRANGLETDWGADDLAAFATAPISGLLLPKIENVRQVERAAELMGRHGGSHIPLWLMVETPAGVLDLASFAGHERVEALVMGTSDLVKEMRASHIRDRSNLAYALQHCLLVARRHAKDILDGVHLDFKNLDSFEEACRAGKAMGFDGKTLIHPSQIDIANDVFGYSVDDIDHARRVLEVWQAALGEGKGVAVLDGQLVENLHAAEAERVVAFAEALDSREG
jgi:citrate lyase subunit beta/citryl-CoA lyase